MVSATVVETSQIPTTPIVEVSRTESMFLLPYVYTSAGSMLLKIILYRGKPRFRIAKTGLPIFWYMFRDTRYMFCITVFLLFCSK